MPLGTPVLTASTNPAGYVTLTLACSGATRGSIRRITPTGSISVRDSEDIDLVTGVYFVNDYEIPQSVTLDYYAEATNGTQTATTQIVSITGLNRGVDWIAPFGSPLSGMAINVEGVDDLTSPSMRDVAKVLNRRDPVVVNWGRTLPEGNIRFITLEDDERIAFRSMLDSGRTLLFQPRIGFGFEEPLYLSVGDAVEQRVSTAGAEPARVWECQVTLTGPPPPQFVIPVGQTWQNKKDSTFTWTYWTATGQTWLEFAGVA
jgi:hypothetical protein